MDNETSIEAIVEIETLINALKYEGKAEVGSVMGSIMGKNKELRPRARELKDLVAAHVKKTSQMTIADIEDRLVALGVDPGKAAAKKKEDEKGLPALPEHEKGKKTVFRLAPYPSGPLHIGNARMVVLNDEYAKRTGGKLVLCFDDTIGSTKKAKEEGEEAKYVLPEAYDMIRDGLKWLGVAWHEEVYKSDRLDIYQDYCKKLIDEGHAYVCTCTALAFKALKDEKRPCPHRGASVQENLDGWELMKSGHHDEGAAVVRLKTGVELDDPALREPVIMRISDAEHPRVGTKYRLWPMLEFSWALDDHLLGITHVIRGKDLFKEDFIEEFIWNLFGWPKRPILHYGIISGGGLKLSKTHARKQIQAGIYSGWDDPRVWSLQSLAMRGIQPEAIRTTLLDMGLSMTDIDFPFKILYAENKKLIDKDADRYFYVENPRILRISGIPHDKLVARPLVNPLNEQLGNRTIEVAIHDGKKELYLSGGDVSSLTVGGQEVFVRLKDLFNVDSFAVGKEGTLECKYHSSDLETARERKGKTVHWVDKDACVPTTVIAEDGSALEGFAELNLEDAGTGKVVQFERFGFVRIHAKEDGKIITNLTHLL